MQRGRRSLPGGRVESEWTGHWPSCKSYDHDSKEITLQHAARLTGHNATPFRLDSSASMAHWQQQMGNWFERLHVTLGAASFSKPCYACGRRDQEWERLFDSSRAESVYMTKMRLVTLSSLLQWYAQPMPHMLHFPLPWVSSVCMLLPVCNLILTSSHIGGSRTQSLHYKFLVVVTSHPLACKVTPQQEHTANVWSHHTSKTSPFSKQTPVGTFSRIILSSTESKASRKNKDGWDGCYASVDAWRPKVDRGINLPLPE